MAFLFRWPQASSTRSSDPNRVEQGSVSELYLTPERFWAQAALFNDTIDEKLQNDDENAYHFVLDQTEFLEKSTYLGSGSLGSVHAVKIRGSAIVAVGKTEHYHRKGLLRNERNIIKDLKHRHITKFLGSFEINSRRPEYTLVMSPVGDSDLATFLDRAWMPDQGWKPQYAEWLNIWFGCLSSALEYIHDQKIRHEDIKPANIIHRRERVFFTDFSSSSTFHYKDTTSTETPALATQRYAAPEARTLSHGARTDVFALGCVFLEMFIISQGTPLDEFRRFCTDKYASAGYQESYKYRLILEDLNSWFLEMKQQQTRHFWDWTIRPMMHPDRKERPTAHDICINVRNSLPEYFAVCSCSCSPGFAGLPPSGNALRFAVSDSDVRLVHQLLYQGAEIDALGNKNRNALYIAAANGDSRIVETLLRWGANVNAYEDKERGNCLHAAVGSGHTKVARMLLENGIDAHFLCHHYGSPLGAAARRGSVELIQLLLNVGTDINACSGDGSSALHQASYRGHTAAAQMLLDNGANVDAANSAGQTPLLVASQRDSAEMVYLLLKSGANINTLNCSGESALTVASTRSNARVVRLLSDWRTNVNYEGGPHENATYGAASKGGAMATRIGASYRDSLS